MERISCIKLIFIFAAILVAAKMQPTPEEMAASRINTYINANCGNGTDMEIGDAIYRAKVKFHLSDAQVDSIQKKFYN